MSPNPRGNDQKLPIFLHWLYIRSIDLTIYIYHHLPIPFIWFGKPTHMERKPPTVSFSSFGPVAFLLLPSYFIPTKIPSFVRRLLYQPYKFSSMCFSIRFGFHGLAISADGASVQISTISSCALFSTHIPLIISTYSTNNNKMKV